MRNNNNFERMIIALLVAILMVVTHSNWTMRKAMSTEDNPQVTESIMNDEEVNTSRNVNGEVSLGAHASASVRRNGAKRKGSASNVVTGEVKGEVDLGESANGADLQTEENEADLGEPEDDGLSNDNAQRTSEAVGEKVGEVLGQLGDGFRNVIGTLDDKLNDE